MLPRGSDVPEPTLIWRRQADLAEQRRPFVAAIALRNVCDQNSRRGTFEKVDVILLDAVRAGFDQGGVEALSPAMRDRQCKLRQEATGDQRIRPLQETTKIFVQGDGLGGIPQMQRSGEISRAELNPTAREQCQDLHLQRVDHINESDAGEVAFQMPEVDIAQMPTSENSHMIPAGKLAGEKAFAGLKMALP